MFHVKQPCRQTHEAQCQYTRRTQKKTPTNATNIKPLRNDVSRETLFPPENNLALRNHLRLFEPEAFTSTLSGKGFQKDTEHSVFHVKHAFDYNDMAQQYA